MANVPTEPPRGFQKCKDCTAVGPPCDVCQGTGKTRGAACGSCKGTGLEVHTTVIQSCKG
jgi:DnaJ-class molecular chaperone